MKRFGAPWGRMLIGMSVFVTVVIVALSWGPVTHLHARNAVVLSLLTLLLPGAALFIVRGYTVTPDAILVHRLFWSTRLPREGLVSATAEPGAMKGSLRTCGNGGMFSFTGWYWSRKLGHFHAYVTDLNRTVVLRWKKKTAVLSPDDPEGFVKELLG